MNYRQRYVISCTIWCHLNNLKKREKYPWRNANFSKVAGLKPATLLNLTLLHGCFSRFLNCTNGTKSRIAPHLENFQTSMIELFAKTVKL